MSVACHIRAGVQKSSQLGYGALYNWYAATHYYLNGYGYLYNYYSVIDARNIAPVGWHVPSDAEFNTLEAYLGMTSIEIAKSYDWRGTDQGTQMKNTTGWTVGNGTNTSGFSALSGGYRYYVTGVFYSLGDLSYWWSSTSVDPSTAWYRRLDGTQTKVYKGAVDKNSGKYIRFIKDDSVDSIEMTGNDGKIYPTIKIGTQVWTKQNLAETKYRNGDLITKVTDNTAWSVLTTEAYCAYNNDESNAFGYTYNLAPAGWHMPTELELGGLLETINGNSQWWFAPNGGCLKSIEYWDSPNTGGTDSLGFNVKGTGYRSGGIFYNINQETRIASITNRGSNIYDALLLRYDDGGVAFGGYDYAEGSSIRLIKDDSTDSGTVTDIDGNVYSTVKIGTQVWMVSNLKVTHYNDGTLISNVTDNTEWAALTTGGMCYYNNDPLYV
jgi:uncharacterized protein (TIGR02145 family)